MAWSDVADFFNTTHSNNGNGTVTTYGPGMQVIQDAWTGLQNWWYNLTGQSEKTSTVEHNEEREDTAYQRAAADMAAAGLSKYQGVSPASSNPAPDRDMSLINKASAIQDLKAKRLSNKAFEHDLGIAEQLGIRTGDQNYAAKWAELGNVLFGFDPTKVEGGLVPWAFRMLKGLFNGSGNGEPEGPVEVSSGSSSGGSSGYASDGQAEWFKEYQYDQNPVLVGASYDQFKNIAEDMTALAEEGPEAIEKFVGDLIKGATDRGEGEYANYSKLPEGDKIGVFADTLDASLDAMASDIVQKGLKNEKAVERVADFLSRRYSADKDDVIKKLWDRISSFE